MFRLVSSVLSFAVLLDAQGLRPEPKSNAWIDRRCNARCDSVLGKLVNINSGTNNGGGVQAVATVMDAEFRALGFVYPIAAGDHLAARTSSAGRTQGYSSRKAIAPDRPHGHGI